MLPNLYQYSYSIGYKMYRIIFACIVKRKNNIHNIGTTYVL